MMTTETRPVAATGSAAGETVDFVPPDDFFRSPGEPFGRERIDVVVGPLRLRLLGLSDAQAEALAGRFHPFTDAAAGAADLEIDLRRAPVDAFLRWRAGTGERHRLDGRVDGARRYLWSYEFAGWVDPAGRRALLAIVEERGARFERGLENFLRVMTAHFVLTRGGFLLHAAAVVRDGRAHLFFGPSGSGKTTVAGLSPGDTILSDDLTLVVPGAAGYEAAGIPFGMRHHAVAGSPASYPIAALNRLVQAPRVGSAPLAGARALAEVAGSLPFVMQDRASSARALEVVARALRDLPVHRLEFLPDPSFWRVVADDGREAAR